MNEKSPNLHDLLTLESRKSLDDWLPNKFQSPPGIFKDGYYYPTCYKEAKKTSEIMEALGFPLARAGVSVAAEPYDAAAAIAFLSKKLGTDMSSTIPHYLLQLTSTKKQSLPAFYARTVVSTQDEQAKMTQSIIREYGIPADIDFIDHPPYCVCPQLMEDISKKVPFRIIYDEIKYRLHDDQSDPYKQKVAMLAGIGRNTQKIVVSVLGKVDYPVYRIQHGSKVISLARIAMALVDWGAKNPDTSLFYISTTRLTNEYDSPPQAYLLNKTFQALRWNPVWLGLCIIRRAALRTHPTGAMLVEITPSQYQISLDEVRLQFGNAVDQMVSANKDLF